jgi:signal transduction histidine kinase
LVTGSRTPRPSRSTASSSPSSDSTARVDDHHGLGLSIVRAIAVAHDATLAANALPQGGLPIEIHFPLIPFAMPR